ncbi:ExbD/TolR family protein [Singulisphaera sp. PoT]|uniref:ExbD/TolR family protein n=1 Tax=Singulisphaera sp. PoT TaxID=3411797 RepID=UPI003BF485A1
MRYQRLVAVLVGLVLGSGQGPSRADEFDRLEGEALASLRKSGDVASHKRLSIVDLDALPTALADVRSAFLIVKTDQGNLARLLVSPAFRKQPGNQAKPLPVLMLERFDTFESGNLSTRLAHGKELLLFDGFQFDLDSGQVVPEGQGGDLKFEAANGSPSLVALGSVEISTLKRAPVTTKGEAAGGPSTGRTVLATDYAGRFRLYANGQWSGTLDLKVDPQGAISGWFRSDLNGTSYEVDGQVAREIPPRAEFTIRFPRSRQEFDGHLWTEGKGAMAGTLRMLDRSYGFFAIREGGKFAPQGEEIPLDAAPKTGQHVISLAQGSLKLDGQAVTEDSLAESLKKLVAANPATSAILDVDAAEPFQAVQKVMGVIRGAGVNAIRLAPNDPQP